VSLGELRAALAAEGGTLAATLASEADLAEPVGARDPIAVGPRTRGRDADYELLLGMIREGVALHYADSRVVCAGDPDLALLLGDQLYALGLSRLAALGDLESVTQLGDTISLVAQAQCAGDSELAGAVWTAGITAVGWGMTDALERAKRLTRAGHPEAREALLRASAAASAGAGPRDARLDVDDTLRSPFN
jgi:hypothetical protein